MEANEESAAPRFATVVRGYDRMQVDDYVDHLNQWVEQADLRAQQYEASAAEPPQRSRSSAGASPRRMPGR